MTFILALALAGILFGERGFWAVLLYAVVFGAMPG